MVVAFGATSSADIDRRDIGGEDTMGLDELDFYIAMHQMMIDSPMNHEELARHFYYRFGRVFSQDLIAQRVSMHSADPQAFFARVSYLRDRKIEWPWEKASTQHQNDSPYPDVAVAAELLIEINNLVHFDEPAAKIQALLRLAEEHFAIDYTAHLLSASLYDIDITDRAFLMVATTKLCSERWFLLFGCDHVYCREFMGTFGENSWSYVEEPESGKDWYHAAYVSESPTLRSSVMDNLLRKGFAFIASLENGTEVRLPDTQPTLVRHAGRMITQRWDGWYLRVLEEMDRCGNRNAYYALQRGWG